MHPFLTKKRPGKNETANGGVQKTSGDADIKRECIKEEVEQAILKPGGGAGPKGKE